MLLALSLALALAGVSAQWEQCVKRDTRWLALGSSGNTAYLRCVNGSPRFQTTQKCLGSKLTIAKCFEGLNPATGTPIDSSRVTVQFGTGEYLYQNADGRVSCGPLEAFNNELSRAQWLLSETDALNHIIWECASLTPNNNQVPEGQRPPVPHYLQVQADGQSLRCAALDDETIDAGLLELDAHWSPSGGANDFYEQCDDPTANRKIQPMAGQATQLLQEGASILDTNFDDPIANYHMPSTYNSRVIYDLQTEECATRCLGFNWCKSFDFSPSTGTCRLNDGNRGDAALVANTGGEDFAFYEKQNPYRPQCANFHKGCADWSRLGYCSEARFTDWMGINCQQACGTCQGSARGDVSAEVVALQQNAQLVNNYLNKIMRVQIMTQSLIEQNVRTAGGSGISQVRGGPHGIFDYSEPAAANYGFMNCHNHANNIRTVGLAELKVVLNGVQFQTRHNDYRLRQPWDKNDPIWADIPSALSRDSKDTYGALIDIPYDKWTGVPPSVTAAGEATGQPVGHEDRVQAEIDEMRNYFQAYYNQDASTYDYRPYFQPLLVYLEGAWIIDQDALEEPFASDRHFIDAKTWAQLHDEQRFVLNSGKKPPSENLAMLPHTIRSMEGDSFDIPAFANWEYRIAVWPLDFSEINHDGTNNLPLDQLRLRDHVHTRLSNYVTNKEAEFTHRGAVFEFNYAKPNRAGATSDGFRNWRTSVGKFTDMTLLDYIMRQVPGKDGPGGVHNDTSQGEVSVDWWTDEDLNTNFYSRMYKTRALDAAGRSSRRRGFNDPFLFSAMTAHERVSGLLIDLCATSRNRANTPQCTLKEGSTNEYEPIYLRQRWTWAIPIELIYLNPLQVWNPYGFPMLTDAQASASSTLDGATPENALEGVSPRWYYFTPDRFFTAVESPDPADTSSSALYVKNPYDGSPVGTRGAGIWITLPAIAGIGPGGANGVIRQRFPVAPIHEQSNTVWKEAKAIQKILSDEIGFSY
jgi:hypothetical protein